MTITEVREIREKQSLQTIGMNTEDLRDYFTKRAHKVQLIINEMRKNGETSYKTCNEDLWEDLTPAELFERAAATEEKYGIPKSVEVI